MKMQVGKLEFTEQNFTELQFRLQEAQQELSEVQSSNYKIRKDYMNEVCLMREQMTLLNSTKSEALLTKYRQSLNVRYFDELDGLNPRLLDLFNHRIRALKDEAELSLADKEKRIQQQARQLSVYERLKPATFAL